ncbi:MAG: RNA methyltransferase [Chitinophagales bacterium]
MQHKKIPNENLGRISESEFKKADKTPVIVVLDNIRSFNNVGSVFRSSDAFRIEAIYLCGITPRPPHRDIQKTALGATETVDWQYFEKTSDALDQLEKNEFETWAIEQTENSISLENFDFSRQKKRALVFGNEVEGVAQSIIDRCAGCIEIPQIGSKHSLNIAVSSGIVLWECFKSLRPE